MCYKLLVHHDNNGHLRDAIDTAPGALEPETTKRRREPAAHPAGARAGVSRR